jgi:hypothetical protein
MIRALTLAVMAAASTLVVSAPVSAQSAKTRQSMERCVETVLSRMARAKAPEVQVGQTVISHCDAPLRAVLASAIETGEASICSVESCIGMARDRAAGEATLAYRARLTR